MDGRRITATDPDGQTTEDTAINNSGNSTKPAPTPIPQFKKWKGEEAVKMLEAFWEVSGGDMDFVKTMAAENGSFNPKLKHPKKNRNGTRDYSFGLNSAYHMPFIQRILNGDVSYYQIAEYHWNIYNEPDGTTSCGVKKFCGYNRRNDKNIINLFI